MSESRHFIFNLSGIEIERLSAGAADSARKSAHEAGLPYVSVIDEKIWLVYPDGKKVDVTTIAPSTTFQ